VRAWAAPVVKRLGTHDTKASGTTHSLATGSAREVPLRQLRCLAESRALPSEKWVNPGSRHFTYVAPCVT
jgi:hypothetical protein